MAAFRQLLQQMQKDYARFGVKHAQGQALDAKQTMWILMVQRHLLTRKKSIKQKSISFCI